MIPKAIVVVANLETTSCVVRDLLNNSLPISYFDPTEYTEIVDKIISVSTMGLLGKNKNEELNLNKIYNDCHIGVIDYLEYKGCSPENSFNIAHMCDMHLINAVIQAFPEIDNDSLVVEDYSLKGDNSLFIKLRIK